MGKITGFKEFKREMPEDRPVTERVQDWKDVHKRFPEEQLKIQASRCMDCGIPF
ncbi:MAG: glutamate synthase, partial [Elusimicrobia bacterium]|nr:glutamate synthase [Elusimicrobiota bacterium]